MNEERYIELLNAEIDGGLDDAERHELDEYLATSADVRKYQADLRTFATMMNSVPDRSPDPELRQKIIDQVKLPSRHVFKVPASSRPLPKGTEIGLAFAAGILLALGINQFVPSQGADNDFADMVGTLVADQGQPKAPVDDSLALESDEVTAAVSMRHDRDVYEIEFDLASDGPIGVEADFSAAGLEFGGFARRTAGAGEFHVADGKLMVETRGVGRFALFLQNPTRKQGQVRVDILLYAGGEQVYRGALTAP